MNNMRHRSILFQVNIQSFRSKVPSHRLAGLDDAMRLRQVLFAEHLYQSIISMLFKLPRSYENEVA